MPASSETGLMAAVVGEGHGEGNEEWGSDSGATSHMPHTLLGMITYKKASPGTTVEVAKGTILPVDGFGTVEVDLDQLRTSQ